VTKRNTIYAKNESQLFVELFSKQDDATLLDFNLIQNFNNNASTQYFKESNISKFINLVDDNKSMVEVDKVHIEADKPKKGKFTFFRNFKLDEFLKSYNKTSPATKRITTENKTNNKENIIKPILKAQKQSIFAGYNKTENSKKTVARFNHRLSSSFGSTRKLNQSYDCIYEASRHKC
jgi:hypothetical protein